ncbi:2-oxo acid dehydrogenase subunit E2 [Paramicrobacterium chengjingii]|uniref:2-oxo acid dehydrogenase subunit E2 n=1 Tax=Paramicrobacterium chengjingii TaxID=2769067 RepID=UPI0014244BD5|nr:2-oxo acid dehydrogenase subunit E2 [Microbacterium chengjingii]
MHEIYVPSLGMASEGVYLAEWNKSPGSNVKAGETVAHIETDKAELTVEAPVEGVLGRHRFEAESEVPNGATIAVVLGDGEIETDDTDDSTGDAEPAVAAPASTSPASDDVPVTFSDAGAALVRADRRRDPDTGELEPYELSPRTRANQSRATTTQRDAPAKPNPSSESSVVRGEPSNPRAHVAPSRPGKESAQERHRAAVATAVTRSWAEIPHFAVVREMRAEHLVDVQDSFRALDRNVTLTDVIVKAFALALTTQFESDEIDVGLAVATPRGVAIPVLRDVARRDVLGIASSRALAVNRALDGAMNDDDAAIPQSTISNLGAYGVDSFTGIVPVGQTSILTIGAATLRPVIEKGALAVGKSMTATLNVDHRVWDGQHAAELLRTFADVSAQPLLLNHISR